MLQMKPRDVCRSSESVLRMAGLSGAVMLALISAGCKTTPDETQALSLEEAKEVAIELEGTVLAAPPRSLAGLGDLPYDINDIAEAPACVVPSEKLTRARVDEITRGLSATDMGGRHNLLNRKAIEQQRVGHLSNAILFQRESIRQTPADWLSHQGGHRLFLSRLLAQVG